MHKKSRAGKKTGARTGARSATHLPVVRERARKGSRAAFSRMPATVGDILSRDLSQLRGVAAHRAPARASSTAEPQVRARTPAAPSSVLEQQAWLEWMRALLPPELAAHLVRVLPKSAAGLEERELVAFADTPAWCARLRYALLELEQQARARDPTVKGIRARVLMLAPRPG